MIQWCISRIKPLEEKQNMVIFILKITINF
jgi:hypothetical protein